jgi:hypothetical protein
MVDRPNLTVIDNPHVPILYCNKLVSASFDGGAVVVTLGVTRFPIPRTGEAPKEGEQSELHVTARLALSPNGAVEVMNALTSMVKAIAEVAARQQQQPAGAGVPPNVTKN